MRIWPNDDPVRMKAATALLERGDARFFVIVLAEALWVLARPLRQPRSVLIEVIGRLMQASNIEIDRRDTVEAAFSRWLAGQGGFTDHLIGEINRSAGCGTTFTFDRTASLTRNFTRLPKGS